MSTFLARLDCGKPDGTTGSNILSFHQCVSGRMPENSIPLFKVFMSQDSVSEVASTLTSGYIGQGAKVDSFESRLKSYLGWDYLATVNSATSAEHLALHMLRRSSVGNNEIYLHGKSRTPWPGLQDGDEVLTSPLTCTATNWPILANRLSIKWVDVDPLTLNVDMDDLERKISPRTKIIFVVHWGGYPVDLNRLDEICTKAEDLYGFRPVVIEDCAHAFGSVYKGDYIGTSGNWCTFSFQAIKHLTTGDGGMLTMPSAPAMNRAKLLRWYGIDRESDRKDFRCEANVPEWGFKFHMNDIAASIGIHNLQCIDSIIMSHRQNAKYYDDQLEGVPGLTLLRRQDEYQSSFWIYSLLVDDKLNFHRAMQSRGIAASQVHERNDIHTCVSDYRSLLPNLDQITPKLTAIPVGWWVSEEQRESIVQAIKDGW